MDYQKIYDDLCFRGKRRLQTTNKVKAKQQLGYYVERHRIIPGNVGGKYNVDNITWLTRKEHRLAHVLLAKLSPTKENVFAAARMGTKQEWLKKLTSEHQKGRKLSEETKRKMSESRKGQQSPTKGMKMSLSTRLKHSENNAGDRNPFFGKTHDLSSKQLMREKKQMMWEIVYSSGEMLITKGLVGLSVPEGTLRYLESTGRSSKKHKIESVRKMNV